MEQVMILDPAEADDSTYRALRQARRTQEFSDHVFVVEGDAPAIDALRALPGIKTPAQLDPAETARLSLIEKLSIRAWSERKRAPKKVRPGDGVSWGHKDFQAP
ncbi:hypothetical protein [Methylobacterium sp. 17Sr1-1]|uniref:hypothetical protein n=1 Tax=Methylobacterium sp. 17Sr1-1 TaxID=2202826 RepID=UPI000D6EE02D|nr:hypothetical protein [Methylobacterium sp. 17Sr1-1]AWN50815.1 hypothetical protein DK412_02990 [Methylobacterium sp. 17Sr1-1]